MTHCRISQLLIVRDSFVQISYSVIFVFNFNFCLLFFCLKGLRVLGIGRNEFLSLISDLKTNSSKIFRKPIQNFLPKIPVHITMLPWWKVEIGYVLESDVKVR